MQRAADTRRETLTPRTGIGAANRPEDTAGGRIAPVKRRDLLKWGLFGSLLVSLGAFGGAFVQYFQPKKVGTFGGKVTVPATIADLPVGADPLRVREGKFYLVHIPEGLLALYWKCKHLGCTVPWKGEEEFQGQVGVFHCPCHGSIYLRNGQNVAGPAPAPLDYMSIDLSGGKIVVDTGKISTRTRFEASQVTPV